jgi:hypothetical protein
MNLFSAVVWSVVCKSLTLSDTLNLRLVSKAICGNSYFRISRDRRLGLFPLAKKMLNFETKKIHWDIILPYLRFRDQLSTRLVCRGFRNHRLLDLTKSFLGGRGICQNVENIVELILMNMIKCPEYFTNKPTYSVEDIRNICIHDRWDLLRGTVGKWNLRAEEAESLVRIVPAELVIDFVGRFPWVWERAIKILADEWDEDGKYSVYNSIMGRLEAGAADVANKLICNGLDEELGRFLRHDLVGYDPVAGRSLYLAAHKNLFCLRVLIDHYELDLSRHSKDITMGMCRGSNDTLMDWMIENRMKSAVDVEYLNREGFGILCTGGQAYMVRKLLDWLGTNRGGINVKSGNFKCLRNAAINNHDEVVVVLFEHWNAFQRAGIKMQTVRDIYRDLSDWMHVKEIMRKQFNILK